MSWGLRGINPRVPLPYLTMEVRKLIDSFNYAISGLVYALRTQRNMRIHFGLALLALLLGIVLDISKVELLILFFTISLVIISEMINTAVEAVVDMYTRKYHPLAKIAKNVAAGAVLFSAINALIVGYLIFVDDLTPFTLILFNRIRHSPTHLTFICLVVNIFLVIIGKSWKGKGTPLKGGMPSGHSAIAFTLATAIALMTSNPLIATLVLILALLVAQSRVEAGIHNTFEVITGGLIGLLVTILIFQFLR